MPTIQKEIIAKANARGLPVITATQMLESMIEHARPTRAEASDVANAILDGTDAVMLSAETAVGKYPVEAVQVMARIACESEPYCKHGPFEHHDEPRTHAHAVATAAHILAREAGAHLIAAFTRTGTSAHLISKERPVVPVVAYTPFEQVYRRLALWWGVMPRRSELLGTTEQLIAWVDEQLQEEGLVQRGDEAVIMGGMPVAGAPAQTSSSFSILVTSSLRPVRSFSLFRGRRSVARPPETRPKPGRHDNTEDADPQRRGSPKEPPQQLRPDPSPRQRKQRPRRQRYQPASRSTHTTRRKAQSRPLRQQAEDDAEKYPEERELQHSARSLPHGAKQVRSTVRATNRPRDTAGVRRR